jgi:hypothetical protein
MIYSIYIIQAIEKQFSDEADTTFKSKLLFADTSDQVLASCQSFVS